MVVRRLAAAALGVVFSAGLAIAREPLRANPSERPSNWAAPPYWTPSEGARETGLEPMPEEVGEPGLRPLGSLPAPLPFSAITPCRIVDTRGANGPFGGPALVANATRTFNLPSVHAPAFPSTPPLTLSTSRSSEGRESSPTPSWPPGPPATRNRSSRP